MRENKLLIRINKPVSEVFDFTINPQNTPLWIDSILEEKIDTQDIKIGTQYINVDMDGSVNSYRVSMFERNKIFELTSLLPEFKVRYTYRPISEHETELEYFEWDQVDLINPFTQEALNKLKLVMESK